jgi:transposase
MKACCSIGYFWNFKTKTLRGATSMTSIPVFVGLDYHQDSVQVCVLDEDGSQLVNRSVRNESETIRRLISRHGVPKRMGIEACCGAADLAEDLAVSHGLPIQLAHPGYVNRMKRSPDKTDLGDAQLLADLVRVNYLPRVWLAPRDTRELRRLVRFRSQLVQRQTDTKLRIRGLLRENRQKCLGAQAWTKNWYKWLATVDLSDSDRWIINEHLDELVSLSGRIGAVNAKIKMHLKDDPVAQILLAQTGVGMVTAATMRAEIGRFDRFNSGKQLSRFCGVTPRNASSGARQADAGLIKAGNSELRVVLVELAHRLISRIKGRWADMAHRMLIRGKPKNVTVAAIANRWVRWLYHEMQRQMDALATSAQAQQKGPALTASTVTST